MAVNKYIRMHYILNQFYLCIIPVIYDAIKKILRLNINKMECQYCKKLFTTTSSLGRHKRTAKKCISSRNEKYTSKYKCDKCDKLCRDYTELTKHLSTCKAVNVNEINVRYKLAAAYRIWFRAL